jgi:hypothetical protein
MPPLGNVVFARTARKVCGNDEALLLSACDRSDVLAFDCRPPSKSKIPTNKRRVARSSNGSLGGVGYHMASDGSWDSSTEDLSDTLRDDFLELFGAEKTHTSVPRSIDAGNKEGKERTQRKEPGTSTKHPRPAEHKIEKAESESGWVARLSPRDESPCGDRSNGSRMSPARMRTNKMKSKRHCKLETSRKSHHSSLQGTQSKESNEKSFEIIPKREYTTPAPPSTVGVNESDNLIVKQIKNPSVGYNDTLPAEEIKSLKINLPVKAKWLNRSVEGLSKQGLSQSRNNARKKVENASASMEVLKIATKTLAAKLKNRTSSVVSGHEPCNEDRKESLTEESTTDSQAEKKATTIENSEVKQEQSLDQRVKLVGGARVSITNKDCSETKMAHRHEDGLNAVSDFQKLYQPPAIKHDPAPARQVRQRLLRSKGRNKIPDFLEIPGCMDPSFSFGSATQNSIESENDEHLFHKEEIEPVRTNEVVEIVVAPLPSSQAVASRDVLPQSSLLDKEEDRSTISARSRISFRSLNNTIRRVRSLHLRNKDEISVATHSHSVATTGSLFRRKMWRRRARGDDRSRSGASLATTGTAKRKWFSFRRGSQETSTLPQQQNTTSTSGNSIAAQSIMPVNTGEASAEELTLVEEFFAAFAASFPAVYGCVSQNSDHVRHCMGDRDYKDEKSRKVTFTKKASIRNAYDSDSDDSDDDVVDCLSR